MDTDVLLATKLYVPPTRSTLVPRRRLFERLDRGLSRRLTLISAPAGFGKTTLLSDWVAQVHVPVAWISLDESDNDPDRFLTYFVAAVQAIEPTSGLADLARGMRHAPQPLPVESFLTAIVNELVRLERRAGFVLDDYHVITSQAVHDILAFLLEHLPPTVHIYLTSRTDPPLPLSRMRVRDELNELGADLLRFSLEEADAFLSGVMGLRLTSESVAQLKDRTEGWIAALQLAALTLRDRDDPERAIGTITGADRLILRYLAEEILQRQPEHVQDFLLRTSILNRLSGPLCDRVLGRSGSQALLDHLESANLLIIPLDNQRRWYRYHQLFADFLRGQLSDRRAGELADLHRRAAGWYAAEGFADEAVGHALAAGDSDLAASLVERSARALLTGGEVTTLVRWVEALPADLVRSRPRLGLTYTWASIISGRGNWNTIQATVEEVARALGAGAEDARETLAASQTGSPKREALRDLVQLQAFQARNAGNWPLARRLFQAASEYSPPDAWYTRMVSIGGLGSIYLREGNVQAAERAFAEAVEASLTAESPFLTAFATTLQGQMQAMQGRLNRAVVTYRHAIDLFSSKGTGPLPFSGQPAVGLAEIHRERNDLEQALHFVGTGLQHGRQFKDFDALLPGYVTLSRVLQAQGDWEGAQQALSEGERFARNTGDPDCIIECQSWQARLALARGDLAAAEHWAARYRPLPDGALSPVSGLGRPAYMTYARLLLAQGRAHDALVCLEGALAPAEEDGRLQVALEALTLVALCQQSLGRRDQALRTLARALLIAEPEGFIRTFLDAGPEIAALLRAASAKGHSPDYASRLLAAFGEAVPIEPPIEPLSERELEVLRLLTQGLTNSEIATELIIALSTVKTHVNHIYGKLGVRTRAQAIARARDLKML